MCEWLCVQACEHICIHDCVRVCVSDSVCTTVCICVCAKGHGDRRTKHFSVMSTYYCFYNDERNNDDKTLL